MSQCKYDDYLPVSLVALADPGKLIVPPKSNPAMQIVACSATIQQRRARLMTRSSKRNLFFVLSPFQLMCAQEARERFCSGETNHLVFIDRNGPGTTEYTQKQNELDDKWDNVSQYREPRRRGFPRFLYRLRNTALILSRQGMRKGKVFLGDPYLNWFRYMGKIYGDEVIWLDDGAASINVIKKFLGLGLLRQSNATTPKFFTVFSSPELEQRTAGAVMQNDLQVWQRRRQSGQRIKPKSAIFIGQWLSERGGESQEDELTAFREGCKRYEGWDLTYISHRHESQEKLDEIRKVMPVKSYTRSIETELLQQEDIPELILSWYSTAMFTLGHLFPEIKREVLFVPLREANERQKAEWINVYEAMVAQGVACEAFTQWSEKDA